MSSQASEARSSSFSDRAKLFGGGAGVGLLILFFLQNLQDVELNLLWFTWDTSMVWALLLSAGIGAAAAFAFTSMRRRSRDGR